MPKPLQTTARAGKGAAGGGTAIVAISRKGAELGRALAASLAGDQALFVARRYLKAGDEAVPFDLPARPLVQRVFAEYRRLVLLMPVGAAVRLLAPCLGHKHRDPAVVCVDDAGRFAVSLVSGHLGGADRLAQEVARILGATPVITSASHATESLAVDLLGHEFGWKLEADPVAVTRASAAAVNGDPVGLYQEAGEPDWWPGERPLPGNIRLYPSLVALADSSSMAALVITDRLAPGTGDGPSYASMLPGKHLVLYRPRSLVVGLGCRRLVSLAELEQLLDETFRRFNLARDSIRSIATAELKRHEPSIRLLGEKLGVPVQHYSAAELNSVFAREPSGQEAGSGGLAEGRPEESAAGSRASANLPTPSPAPRRLLGLWGVSEPAALLAAGSRQLLVTKQKTARATIAVARMAFGRGHG